MNHSYIKLKGRYGGGPFKHAFWEEGPKYNMQIFSPNVTNNFTNLFQAQWLFSTLERQRGGGFYP